VETSQEEHVEAVLACIEAVLDHVRSREPFLTSRIQDASRQYGAASLGRGCDIVRSGIAALRGDEPEAIGGIARIAWECWLTGAFLVCGGKKALIRMEAEQLRQNSNLARLNQLPPEVLEQRWVELRDAERLRQMVEDGREEDDESEIKFQSLSLEQIAREAGPMVEAATGKPADLLVAYNMFYRAHSAWDTHGLQALDSRIVLLEGEDRVELKSSTSWLEPHKPLAVATSYLGMLAGLVYDGFGVSTDELSALVSDLLSRMGEGAGLGTDLGLWAENAVELLHPDASVAT
jgi:hypothetical protein